MCEPHGLNVYVLCDVNQAFVLGRNMRRQRGGKGVEHNRVC